MPRALGLVLPATVAAIAVTSLVAMAQQGGAAGATPPAPKFATPAAKPALFFRESWRQPAALDASTEWDAAFPVTPAAVTNPDLELKVYDPNAKPHPRVRQGSPARLAAARLDRHVVRDPVRLQPEPGARQGGARRPLRSAEPVDRDLWRRGGDAAAQDQQRGPERLRQDALGDEGVRLPRGAAGGEAGRRHLAGGRSRDRRRSRRRGLRGHHRFPGIGVLVRQRAVDPLDISRVVTRGTWVEKPDLSNVEEVGFADLLQGTGHGWGGFVNVGKIEVYGKPVQRTVR